MHASSDKRGGPVPFCNVIGRAEGSSPHHMYSYVYFIQFHVFII